MSTTPSIKVMKTFTFEGQSKTFSNRYHFNGGTPADAAHWTTFSDAVVAAEKAIYAAGVNVTITQTIGYAAGSDVPVFTKTYAVVGTGVWSNATLSPGHMAALIRYSTTARTSKNHPVYLFNYYHACCNGGSSAIDTVMAAEKTAKQTYATAWISGFSDGTNTLVRAGPNGATATGMIVENYLSHRDFS